MAALATRQQYQDAIERAAAAARAYYNTDTITMDDGTYDALIATIRDTEAAHPDWVTTTVTTAVAGGVGAGDVAHTSAMLSLDNVFSDEELLAWGQGLTRRLGQPAAEYVVEAKMDGLALVARYHAGRLTQLVTRGSGEAGEDVTAAAPAIAGLPPVLSAAVDLEVRGEVMLTDQDLAAANTLRVRHGDSAFVNARNGAAGALRGAGGRDYEIPMTFFAYAVVSLGSTLNGREVDDLDHAQAMAALNDLGISTVATSAAGSVTVTDLADAVTWIGQLLARRAGLGFGVDGAVIKANRATDRATAGSGSRAPHWGIAYKFPPDMALSTLEEVIWQVGRTGVITPRARIAPVFVAGTTVTYATLHNPTDIERKGFRLFDTVSVVRAGDVIPRLEAPVITARTGNEEPIVVPTVCPRCNGPIDRSQVRWRCERGRLCGASEAIRYAASRDCWDIEGLGDKLITQLVDTGRVSDIADLFTLTRADLVGLDRMGDLRASGVLTQIDKARTAPWHRTLTALGIRGTGRSLSRRLAAAFPTMAALQGAGLGDLSEVDGIGPEKATLIRAELDELTELIAKLTAAGVTGGREPEAAAVADEPADLPLAGMTVVVTGSMTGPLAALSRNEVNELIERAGGKSSGSVSARTSLLVAGDKAGSKLAKAQSLAVPVMGPEEFATLVAAHLR